MTYLATGDVTPSEARVQAVTQFIVSRRAQGVSDADTRAYLRLAGSLPLSHPCAGGNGQNLCADWEVSQAFGNASLLSTMPREPAAGEKAGSDGGGFAGLLSLRNLAIVGALAAAGVWLWRQK